MRELLKQIERIPSEWLNAVGRQVLDAIPVLLARMTGQTPDRFLIEQLLRESPYTMDVFRLFLDISQDSLANELNARGIKGDFRSMRHKCSQEPARIAVALVELGLADVIGAHLERDWALEDLLVECYKQTRGRAVRAQTRGAALEDAVEVLLGELRAEVGLSYSKRRKFKSRMGKVGKADFMIPSHKEPRILIEVKAYESTGSKLTDVLGDILKILRARDPETLLFVVTDGVGWYRRTSDRKKLVEYHDRGGIGMIYTRRTLPVLKQDIRRFVGAVQ